MRTISGFALLAATLVAGCGLLGEKPTPGRTLVLSFPEFATNSLSSSAPAAETPQIRQVLSYVEGLLTKEGYRRAPNPTEERDPDYIATFVQAEQRGFEAYCNPLIKVHRTDVLIIFAELGERGHSLHSETKRLAKVLRRDLSKEYGETRVRALK